MERSNILLEDRPRIVIPHEDFGNINRLLDSTIMQDIDLMQLDKQ